MRITIVTPPSQNIEPMIPIFRNKGIKVDHNSIHPRTDFIVITTQAWIHLVDNFHKSFPHIPIVSLTLDFYKTAWTAPNPHGYDWGLYKHYLNKAKELWCISNEVVLRMEEEGINTDKCRLMKIWARFFNYNGEVKDNRYILNPIRPLKWDKNFGWLSKACQELDIPLREPQHKLSEEEFQRTIAECSFMCCELHEASTGGLTLMEGLNMGKPSVVSNSKYMGALDYLGDFGIYFDDNSYDNFKQTIKETWENTPILDLSKCKQHCAAHPSIGDNVDFMIERMRALKIELGENNG
jgi:glycosyltransferase involved in cell wall biosynthesis